MRGDLDIGVEGRNLGDMYKEQGKGDELNKGPVRVGGMTFLGGNGEGKDMDEAEFVLADPHPYQRKIRTKSKEVLVREKVEGKRRGKGRGRPPRRKKLEDEGVDEDDPGRLLSRGKRWGDVTLDTEGVVRMGVPLTGLAHMSPRDVGDEKQGDMSTPMTVGDELNPTEVTIGE